jgi:transcriptional regulator with XRE-family HTH domain
MPELDTPEFADLGKHLYAARIKRDLTQQQLASLCQLSQTVISRMEQGKTFPSLDQLAKLGRALKVPWQWFINGANFAGEDWKDLAIELYALGIVDLVAPNVLLPGAFRPAEQVLALAIAGNQPNPRIVEALPAVLAWNRLTNDLLHAYCRLYDPRAAPRLAWLAETTVIIHRTQGFPGGCVDSRGLELFASQTPKPAAVDDLSRPAENPALPPSWLRWKITYDCTLDTLVARAAHLLALRRSSRLDSLDYSSHRVWAK